MTTDAAKRAAAEAGVALIEDGMVLGLGTGSTMVFALDALAARIRAEGLHVRGVPTSIGTEEQARRLGIELTELARDPSLDLALDGADEVLPGTLHLIKGLGGALLREKIVAQAATRFVVLADESKVVTRLGERAPLPVEVVRFAHEATARRIAGCGTRPVLRQRAGAPVVTDNGNHIYDCHGIDDPERLAADIAAIAGVVETGFFLGGVERALIGAEDGTVRTLTRD
jgi:ribose 5-phosphate isomerase A